jgi:uncharacterized membrane protein
LEDEMARVFAQFDSDRIVAAIAAAEKQTSGEIRGHVTRRVPKDLEERAVRRFRLLGMTKTAERNGVLIYNAPRARQFRILGDAAIHEKCGEGFWKEVAAAMEKHFREGQLTEGVVAGVERVGMVLARHFPRGKKDRNELPNSIDTD